MIITISLFEIRLVCFLRMAIALFSGLWISSDQTLAQVTPDRTLGAENSVVNQNLVIQELPSDLIEGGARRGANLFHSFLDFNVAAGRGVYFNNPAGVENILSRVTGGNLSKIDGRLGVLGSANLFLLNPNGILFGPNASLDVAGSFLASTANSLRFADGTEYRATNPGASSLLTVSVPLGVQFGREQPQAIANAGNLTTGQNLSLIGGTVVSTGQLNAPGGNLGVAAVPPETGVAVSPTGSLTVNLPTDLPTPAVTAIPDAALVELAQNGRSGLVLNENGQIELVGSRLPVAAGDVVVRQLTGRSATLAANHNLTLVESQLQTMGDLNLLARDAVRVRDSVATPFIASAGGQLLVQGNQAVDIFALNNPASGLFSGGNMVLRSASTVGGDAHYYTGGGFRIETLSGEAGNLFSPYDPIIRASGDVTLDNYTGDSLHIFAGGSVTISGVITITRNVNVPKANELPIEVVTLSNPVGSLASEDRLREVTIDDRRQVIDIRAGTTALGTPGLTPIPFPGANNTIAPNPPTSTGQGTRADITIGGTDCAPCYGGLVFLTNQYQPNSSPGVITVAGSIFNPGGLVVLDSKGNITINEFIDGTIANGSGQTIQLLSGRDIKIGKGISTGSTTGNGGFVIFHALGNIETGDVRTDAGNSSNTGKPNGNISIVSKTGSIHTRGTVTSLAVQGDAGNITLYAEKDIFTESDAISGLGLGNTESIVSSTNLGKSGTITVTSNSGTIDTRLGSISSKSESGFAGDIIVRAAKDIRTFSILASSNSGDNNPDSLFGDGASSVIVLESSQGSVKIGETGQPPVLTTTNSGAGFSGDIVINAATDIQITNGSKIESLGNQGFVFIGNSGYSSNLMPRNISIENSSVDATNNRVNNPLGGRIQINGDNFTISGSNARVLAQGNKDGAGAGDVRVITNKVTVADGAEISVNSPSGVAGNLSVFANQILLNQGTLSANTGQSSTNGSANIFLLGKEAFSNDPTTQLSDAVIRGESPQAINDRLGNETISPLRFLIVGNGSQITATATGEASGGNIFIKPQVLLAPQTGNKISANAGAGKGGNIFIFAKPLGIYNIEFRSTGTTTLNDITATSLSGSSGIVQIVLPDINPSRGLNQLPADTADASRRINPICPIAGQQRAANQFVVTGRGGLPAAPDTALSSSVLVGESPPVATQPDRSTRLSKNPTASPPVEAQGVLMGAQGEFILTAHPDSVSPHPSWQPMQNCNPE